MGERSIEVKVGALILVSLALLVVFVLVLGRVTTTDGFNLNVLFVHPGALQPGAPVKIAGGEVGYVDEMTFLGTEGPIRPRQPEDPPDLPPKRTRVKVKIWVEERVRKAILQDADYYITQQGLLGESYLEIGPGTQGASVAPNATVFGTDPPRLDQAMSNAANSLETINRILTRNEGEIDSIIASTSRALKTLDQVLSRNEGEVDNIVDHVDEVLVEGRDTLRDARKMYIDNPRIERTLKNLDSTTSLLAARDDDLVDNLDRALDQTNEVLDTIGPEQRDQIREAIASADDIINGINNTVDDAEAIVARVRRGEGTVGALLMDEEVYDDLKELLRDLKHNPWKFFWRE